MVTAVTWAMSERGVQCVQAQHLHPPPPPRVANPAMHGCARLYTVGCIARDRPLLLRSIPPHPHSSRLPLPASVQFYLDVLSVLVGSGCGCTRPSGGRLPVHGTPARGHGRTVNPSSRLTTSTNTHPRLRHTTFRVLRLDTT